MEEIIYKWALKNAFDYNGKANAGAVIPKVIGENPDAKKDIKALSKKVAEIVAKVNKMDAGLQLAELKKIDESLLEKQKKETRLPELPNAVEGKVVMMFPPEPSKYNHLGHAKAAYLNYYYAKKYKGQFILRIEDTNPEKSTQEFYDAMLRDLSWLGLKWDKIDPISDHLQEFYKYAEELIKKNHAYICGCSPEKTSKNREEKKECKCRKTEPKENMLLWKKMLKGEFKKGEYVLRIKLDMKHKNAAMRDPGIMRTNLAPHYRMGTKYKVWPLYDFETAVMNIIEKITHRCRSKEFEMKAELQNKIMALFGAKPPEVLEFARTEIEGTSTQGREIREWIESGKVSGWDDPRLVTLMALKRRGFTPEAIQNFIIKLGFSKSNSIVNLEMLEAENRKVIDSQANRYSFIEEPVKLKIRNIPLNFTAKVRAHPDFPERGIREYEFQENETHLFINMKDVLDLKSRQIIRLMNFGEIKLEVVSKKEIIASLETKEHSAPVKTIQWIPTTETVAAEIMMPNGSWLYGMAEPQASKLKKDELIQLLRFGFCRVDENTNDKLILRYTHQ